MKLPSISPLLYLWIGAAVCIGDLITENQLNPFVAMFFILAAFIEVIARKQKRIPSVLISFIASLLIIVFIKTNIIDFLKLQNTSLEPDIHEGSIIIYQQSFYRVTDSDLVIIKDISGSRNLLCKIIRKNDQAYQLEIISRKQRVEVSKDKLKGKVIYIVNNQKKS